MHVWAVGGLRNDAMRALANDYLRRAARADLSIRLEELPQGKGGTVRSIDTLVGRMKDLRRSIALDETGDPIRSEPFAEQLRGDMSRGGDIAFLIGGAAGLPRELLAAADRRLSLSAMTLPHELARVVLLEQLYRAATILKGMPYHRR